MRGQPRILGCVQQLLDEQQALERSAGECGAEEQGRLVQQIEHLQERHVTPPWPPWRSSSSGWTTWIACHPHLVVAATPF